MEIVYIGKIGCNPKTDFWFHNIDVTLLIRTQTESTGYHHWKAKTIIRPNFTKIKKILYLVLLF